MPRQQKNYHPRKHLDDGSINPAWKPRASGKALSKFDRADFVAWDGEGINRKKDGKHVYALLANSRGNYICDERGLSTYECLDFICNELKETPKSIHVGFVFSYDAAMMVFADMDFKTVKKIWDDESPFGVEWKGFRVKYRNRKSLTVQRIGNPRFIEDERTGKYKANVDGGGVIWDVFGFFQSSFVKALQKWLPDYPKLDMIIEGKADRGEFRADQLDDFILPYCLAELDALVRLMELLSTYLKEADLKVSRWDGAGAVAASLLKKYGIKEHMGTLPDAVEHAAAHAYFGGRIEILKYGHYEGDVYHYDICSAYPSIQRNCPSLSLGYWKRSDKLTPETGMFSVALVEWKLSTERAEQSAPWSIFPFPYREWGGTVIYPYEGQGWYWLPEVNAALHALPQYKERYKDAYIKVKEVHTFVEETETKPFTFIEELYQKRRRWKGEGKGAEKVLKLGINSLYGKTAQHTGYDEKTGRKPPYHNLCWAGFITSSTRAMLYSAAMQDPSNTLFLATDGIFSTRPLALPIGEALGEWEYKIHDEIVIVQSGVYFLKDGDEWEEFSRGFDKGTLNVDAILTAWSKKETRAYFPSTRFCAMGTATSSKKAWKKRGCWVGIGDDDEDETKPKGRKLQLTTQGTKRNERKDSRGIPVWCKTGQTPADRLIDTFAAFNNAGTMMSKKYPMPWDYEEVDQDVDGVSVQIVETEHYDTYA